MAGGEILPRGRPITRVPPHRICGLGVAHVLEGRQLFADQTVENDLILGAYSRFRRDQTALRERIEREMNRFPILLQRRR